MTDTYTVTLDAAAGHARWHAEPFPDDRPTRAEAEREKWLDEHEDER